MREGDTLVVWKLDRLGRSVKHLVDLGGELHKQGVQFRGFEAVRGHVMAATKLHADDTPVPVLAPGNGRTKTGRLWTYVRDSRPCADPTPPAVWFAYSPDRRGEHPQGHLKLYHGALQADACAGFHPL